MSKVNDGMIHFYWGYTRLHHHVQIIVLAQYNRYIRTTHNLLRITFSISCNTICKAIHVQWNDTCPTVIPRNCACVKPVLIGWKLIFGTSSSGRYIAQWNDFRPIRIQGTGCLLESDWSKFVTQCDVSAAAGSCIQKSTFNRSELV